MNPSKRTIDKYEKRINEIKDSNDPKHKHEYSCLKSKIEQFYENQLKAAKIRLRIKEFEEGERPTNFFLNTEKNNNNKTWTKIICADDSYKSDILSILNTQKKISKPYFHQKDITLMMLTIYFLIYRCG